MSNLNDEISVLDDELAKNSKQLNDTAEAEEKNLFLVALGERVRALRARRGMTRKAVSIAAEVSERHLANLEYGEGNASILVLLQVARALQRPPRCKSVSSPQARAVHSAGKRSCRKAPGFPTRCSPRTSRFRG